MAWTLLRFAVDLTWKRVKILTDFTHNPYLLHCPDGSKTWRLGSWKSVFKVSNERQPAAWLANSVEVWAKYHKPWYNKNVFWVYIFPGSFPLLWHRYCRENGLKKHAELCILKAHYRDRSHVLKALMCGKCSTAPYQEDHLRSIGAAVWNGKWYESVMTVGQSRVVRVWIRYWSCNDHETPSKNAKGESR